MTDVGVCFRCAYWQTRAQEDCIGERRRFPPTWADTETDSTGMWPTTRRNDGCREFETKTETGIHITADLDQPHSPATNRRALVAGPSEGTRQFLVHRDLSRRQRSHMVSQGKPFLYAFEQGGRHSQHKNLRRILAFRWSLHRDVRSLSDRVANPGGLLEGVRDSFTGRANQVSPRWFSERGETQCQ